MSGWKLGKAYEWHGRWRLPIVDAERPGLWIADADPYNLERARLIAAAPEMAELLAKIAAAYEPVDYVTEARALLARISSVERAP